MKNLIIHFLFYKYNIFYGEQKWNYYGYPI